MVFPHFSYFNVKGGICVTSDELDIKINKLYCELNELYSIVSKLRNEWFDKGNYVSVLRLHTFCVRVWDLLDAFGSLTKVEKGIIEGVDL